MLTFQTIRRQNQSRLLESFPDCVAWKGSDWGNALAGETGEACNIIKKLTRKDDNVHVGHLAEELADVLAYLDLLAAYYNIDLERAYISKFNKVSERIGSIVRLKEEHGWSEPNEDSPRW